MADPEQVIGEKPAAIKWVCCFTIIFECVDDLQLVLKVRIQNPKENDFIEIELNREELSYQNLLKLSCCELGIYPEQVEIRKLPNTLLRTDKDILRLQDFQEVELILMKTGNSEWIQHIPPLRNPATTAMLQK
ncbi:putative ANKRD40 C-terminal-like protein [Trichechus inunguis]